MALFYQPLVAKGVYKLDEEESRHAQKVLRLKLGATIQLTDGLGRFYDVRLTNTESRQCEFEVLKSEPAPSRNYKIHVAIAPTKNTDRIEWFVEKAVELGIDKISFILCKNSEVCLLLLMPLIGIGSLIATPDLPLLFSWSFSLWALNRILAQNAKISDAALFGLALGLGGLSKYHIILLLPIAAFVWWRTPNRPALHRWLPITLAVAVLVSSPVWIWNIQNDWASFRFQLDHGLGRKVWKPSWTSEYLLAQIGLLFPIVVWLAIKSTAPLLLRVAAWFPLIFFFFTSFRGYVEANWPIVAHPLVLALAVSQLYAYRRSLQITAAFWAALLAILLGLLAVPGWPAWTLKTKLRDLHQYDTLRTVSLPLEPLYARSYQMASILSFSQQRKVYKLRGMNRRDFFDTLPGSSPTHDTIYLAVNRGDMLPEPWTLWKKTNVTPVDDQFEIWELHRP